MPFFFSDSNSTVEWRAEYWGSSTQLEQRFKEMESTRNRLLQPPPHGILRVGRRRKVHWCPCPVSTIPGSSAAHFPRPFSYSTRKPWFLQSRAMATVTPSSLCLIQSSFLPPNQGSPLRRLLLPRLALFFQPGCGAEGDPSVYFLQSQLCQINTVSCCASQMIKDTVTFGDRFVWEMT